MRFEDLEPPYPSGSFEAQGRESLRRLVELCLRAPTQYIGHGAQPMRQGRAPSDRYHPPGEGASLPVGEE